MSKPGNAGGRLAAARPPGRALLGRVTPDRGLSARDRDLARLALLGLRDADLEHATVEVGGDRLGVGALRQRQRAREGAERALHAVEALLLVLVLGLALARDGERAVLELDVHVLLGHAGEVGAEDEVVPGLDEVHGRHPAAHDGPGGARRLVEHGVEQAVHLALQRVELAERLPADDGHQTFLPSRNGSMDQLVPEYKISVGAYQVFYSGRAKSAARSCSSSMEKWRTNRLRTTAM